MQDNPYNRFVQEIRGVAAGEQRTFFRTGVVTCTDPLMVETGGIVLSGSDLLVNTGLLQKTIGVALTELGGTMRMNGTEETVEQGTLTGVMTEQAGSLTMGSRVAMVTDDGETFVVLCKVVSQ